MLLDFSLTVSLLVAIPLTAHVTLLTFTVVALTVGALHYTRSPGAVTSSVTLSTERQCKTVHHPPYLSTVSEGGEEAGEGDGEENDDCSLHVVRMLVNVVMESIYHQSLLTSHLTQWKVRSRSQCCTHSTHTGPRPHYSAITLVLLNIKAGGSDRLEVGLYLRQRQVDQDESDEANSWSSPAGER